MVFSYFNITYYESMERLLFIFSVFLVCVNNAHSFMSFELGVGARARLGVFNTNHAFETKPNKKLNLEDGQRQSRNNFPIILSFREQTDGYKFNKIFFDFELPYKSINQKKDLFITKTGSIIMS